LIDFAEHDLEARDFGLRIIGHRDVFEMDGDRHQLFHQQPAPGREIDSNGAAVVFQPAARDQAFAFHVADQA